ncbi:methylase [Nitzschia inconspicua]|uniref:Methylase n=1 Tax=Nitzschia inconspicua TaxID=303405 RepID=A0A9K3KSZ8_9STRA|nr:methylase [Nitzschia inconspicua]
MPSSSSSAGPLWQFQELETTIGKDYQSTAEVEVYDETHSIFRDVRQEARHVLKELLQVQPNTVLLDFGCGTGTCVIEAARSCGLKAVHGIDVSPTMIERAKQKVARELVGGDTSSSTTTTTNIQFHHGGFLTYQHADGDGVVDYITTTYALHHLPDLWKQVALQRLAKLLKPNGKLHIHDVVVVGVGTPSTTTRDTIQEEEDGITAKIQKFVQTQSDLGDRHEDDGFLKDDAETHFRDEFSTLDWVLEGMLERAGLDVVSKDVEENGVIVTYLCQKKPTTSSSTS